MIIPAHAPLLAFAVGTFIAGALCSLSLIAVDIFLDVIGYHDGRQKWIGVALLLLIVPVVFVFAAVVYVWWRS